MPQNTGASRTPEHTDRDLDIANEIFRQLGGLPRLKLMIRARNLTSVPSGVTFQFSRSRKYTHVRITLENDQYNLQFYLIRRRRGALASVLNEKMLNMVCAENLRQVFEDTTGIVLGRDE